MAEEKAKDKDGPAPDGAWERRSGTERRKAERRTLEIPVEKDRRSGYERRGEDRRGE